MRESVDFAFDTETGAGVIPDKALERLSQFDATILRTSLSDEYEAKLREAFSAHDES